MTDTLQLNESLKSQLNQSHTEHVTDPEFLAKLQRAEQELEELHRELEHQQQHHQVQNLKNNNESRFTVFDCEHLCSSDNVWFYYYCLFYCLYFGGCSAVFGK